MAPRFMTSHCLFVSAYVSETSSRGVLFVVPHDRLIAMHPIVDGIAVHTAVAQLAGFAKRAHGDAQTPLSPHLYWWHDGIFEHLPVASRNDELVFTPPDSFVDTVLRPLDALQPPD